MEDEELERIRAIAKPIVWRRARAFSINDREDVLQDVLVKYLVAWPNETPENVAAWIETVTGRVIIDRWRKARRESTVSIAEETREDPTSLLISVVRSTALTSRPAVRNRIIRDILALIPEKDANLFTQRFLQRRSALDIAEAQGISVDNVYTQTTRARRKLMDALASRPDLVEALRARHPHIY